jgi:hypothetical protein
MSFLDCKETENFRGRPKIRHRLLAFRADKDVCEILQKERNKSAALNRLVREADCFEREFKTTKKFEICV